MIWRVMHMRSVGLIVKQYVITMRTSVQSWIL